MQFHYQMQLHLPDVQQNFAVIGQQRRTDRITNGENVLIWMYEYASGDTSGDLLVTKE